MDNKPIQVTILGKEYTLRSDAGEEHIKKVAYYLNEKMKLFSGQLSKKDPLKIAVLSALNIADELFRERAEKSHLYNAVEKESIHLEELLKDLKEEIQSQMTE
ncbi:MAG: cell division protein ZapA [Calditrichia bacterium]